MRPIKAILGFAVFGALAATQANAAIIVVHVYDMDFSTNTSTGPVVDPTINLGDTIRWTWDNNIFPHSSTSVAGMTESWNSGDWATAGHTYDHTFTNLGVFNYYCDLHGADLGNQVTTGMAGRITVVPEPASCLALIAGIGALAARRRRKA
jgi:plastocyanin